MDPPGLARRDRGGIAGIAAISAAAALWAVGGVVASALFRSGVDPLELAGARAVIAAAGLAALGAWRRVPGPGADRRLVALLGVSIALVNATYYLAIDRLPVAVAIVLQYTAPALLVTWVAIRTRRAPSPTVAAAVVAAIAGVDLVSELPTEPLGRVDGVGVAMGLGAAVSFASYTRLSELAAPGVGPLRLLGRGFLVASVLWLAWLAPRGWPLPEARDLPGVLFVGIGGTLVPFILYVWGVGRVRAERATVAATLEPVLVSLLGWAWLGQALAALQIAGGALIISAVIAIARETPAAGGEAAGLRAARRDAR